MAKPITHIERPEPSQAARDAQALGEIMDAVAKNKDSLMVFFDIVGELHEAGVLDLVRGLLKNRQQVGAIGITQLNKSGAQRMIKNAVTTMQFFSRLDPNRVKPLLDAVAQGVERAQPPEKPVGTWGLVRTLGDRDVGTSIGVVMNFLRGMGEGMPDVQ